MALWLSAGSVRGLRADPSTAAHPFQEGGTAATAVDRLPETAPGPGRPPRLDRGTLLVPGTGEGWSATLYPTAGEAIIWREDPPPDRSSPTDERAVTGSPGRAPADGGRAGAGPANDARSGRRARGRVRRYAIANGCTRLATLTYRKRPLGSQQVKRDWARFARELKARYPMLAWVRVLEVGELNGRLHVHAGLSRFIPKPELARLWGHGFVDVRKLRTKRGGGEDARAAARYLAKYATKAAQAAAGEHAYEVAQGHQPAAVKVRGWSLDQAWREVVGLMGGELPSYEWSSGDAEDWRGPPVRFLAFG